MNCPMCDLECVEAKINSVPLFDSQGPTYNLHTFTCPHKIMMKNNVSYNHFYQDIMRGTTYMWLPSDYRIVNYGDKSRVSIMKDGDISGPWMQTIFECPTIKPDSTEKLLERIKILLLLS